MSLRHPALTYFREDSPGIPHLWCPGCGLGIVWSATARAIQELQLDTDKVLWVGGSGCTGRMCTYWYKDFMHTLHGRALGFASGAKLARPELTVFIHSGDGECMAIGGNHLIQAARRNIDLNVIAVNNFNFGMTGGQFSPTTPREARTSTSPFGNVEHPFNLCEVVKACGATYVARWTTAHPIQLTRSLVRAVRNKGFSFIEVLSQCPTQYGKMNRLGDGAAMLKRFGERAVSSERARNMKPAELAEAFVVGGFTDESRPEFSAELHRLSSLARREEGW